MKSKPIIFNSEMIIAIIEGRKTQTRRFSKSLGEIGDELWVKETMYSDGDDWWFPCRGDFNIQHGYEFDSWCEKQREKQRVIVPSIHMPRWASRIQLRITGIRVEHLQDISEADAIKEGIEEIFVEVPPMPSNDFDGDWRYDWKDYLNVGEHAGWNGDAGSFFSPKDSFQSLWDSIYGKDQDKKWDANQVVWVYEFEVVE